MCLFIFASTQVSTGQDKRKVKIIIAILRSQRRLSGVLATCPVTPGLALFTSIIPPDCQLAVSTHTQLLMSCPVILLKTQKHPSRTTHSRLFCPCTYCVCLHTHTTRTQTRPHKRPTMRGYLQKNVVYFESGASFGTIYFPRTHTCVCESFQ